jgi:2-phospho-L-lactate/phosphoenolpyruvate guanylyltransferase
MRVLVPFAADTPKTRLESVLSADERVSVARAMLEDVLDAVEATGHDPTVVSTSRLDLEGVAVAVDDRPLTAAINDRLPSTTADEPVAVVMADLALATSDALERLFAAAAAADIVIAPGRGGGTNALVVRNPEFRVDYHGGSYLDHREIAAEVGADVGVVDSFRLGTDIDEPADLVEVLVHGTGRAPDRLREFGFELDAGEGRVTVARIENAPSG